MNIIELKRMLADRADAAAKHLLPGGTKVANEWKAGNVHGDKGDSLSLCLSGPKAGIWADFATGQSGDILDLWLASKGCKLRQAMDEAADWLGVERPRFHKIAEKVYKPPVVPTCAAPVAAVKTYLEGRGITAEVLKRYQVAEAGNQIVFPFKDAAGQLCLIKVRDAVDGAKPKPTSADCRKVLFGWQAIDMTSRDIVICEGEIDALSLAVYGYPALSVPFGGGGGAKQDWIAEQFDDLAQFERIFLALDNDEPGQKAAREIADRLGRERCFNVILPCKDANECLTTGITRDQIRQCFDAAKTMDPEGLHNVMDYHDEVMRLFHPENGVKPGYGMPYSELAGRIRFRPSELTIWTGGTGSGKTQMLSDCMGDWITQGAKICLASLEMPPRWSLMRLVKQCLCTTGTPTAEAITAALNWLNDNLFIIDIVGKASAESLLATMEYARARYGCDVMIIDSLMRLGLDSDDYAGQEKVVYEIVNWVIKRDCHMHLVAHARKESKDNPGAVGLDDVKGASEIVSNAANVMSIYRHRKLEEEIAALLGKDSRTPEEEAKVNAPTVKLRVLKQRNGNFEGKVDLWFSKESFQYRSKLCPQLGRRYVRLGAGFGQEQQDAV